MFMWLCARCDVCVCASAWMIERWSTCTYTTKTQQQQKKKTTKNISTTNRCTTLTYYIVILNWLASFGFACQTFGHGTLCGRNNISRIRFRYVYSCMSFSLVRSRLLSLAVWLVNLCVIFMSCLLSFVDRANLSWPQTVFWFWATDSEFDGGAGVAAAVAVCCCCQLYARWCAPNAFL